MLKKIVANLVSSNQYFAELNNISYSRTIGINNYGLNYEVSLLIYRLSLTRMCTNTTVVMKEKYYD
jgi:hypothetical protein